VTATTSGIGMQLKDGHYYYDGDDPDGVGPFDSVQDAWDAGLKAERTQTWAFPISEDPSDVPYRMTGTVFPEEANVATIEKVFNGNQSEYYEARIEGSYETLTLRISCGSFEAAADVYHQLLKASSKYQ